MFVLKQDEVLNIVNEGLLVEKAVCHILDGECIFLDGLPVYDILFRVFQPLKEELISSIEGSQSGLKSITQDANLVHCEEVRNICQVRLEVLGVGLSYRDIAILQLNEHQGHTIDEHQDIRSSPIILTPDPHLIDSSEGVVGWVVKINQFDSGEVILAILSERVGQAFPDCFVDDIVLVNDGGL